MNQGQKLSRVRKSLMQRYEDLGCQVPVYTNRKDITENQYF